MLPMTVGNTSVRVTRRQEKTQVRLSYCCCSLCSSILFLVFRLLPLRHESTKHQHNIAQPLRWKSRAKKQKLLHLFPCRYYHIHISTTVDMSIPVQVSNLSFFCLRLCFSINAERKPTKSESRLTNPAELPPPQKPPCTGRGLGPPLPPATPSNAQDVLGRPQSLPVSP